MNGSQQPYRLPSSVHGFSHGLTDLCAHLIEKAVLPTVLSDCVQNCLDSPPR